VLLLLLGWVTASVLWSAAPLSSIADLWHWYAVALIFAVVATAVDELAWVIRIGGAALVGGVASSIAALGSGGLRASVGTSALRVQGAAGDPNFLAAWLLLAVLLGLGLLSTQRGGRLRVVTAVAMALLVLALLSTLSRGAYVATLATALTAAVLLRGRRLQVIAVVAGLTCGAGALAVRFPTAFRRVSANDRGDGRYDLWTVALRVVHDSPLHGIGVNAFPQVAADYMRQVSPLRATYLLVGQSHVVHNTYLQLLAELGGVGLALFLALVALSVTCALAARRAFAERGDRSGVVMTEAVLLAVTGVMVTSFFLSAQLDKLLWLVLALGPALLRVATAAPGAETAPDSHRQPAAVRV
jgi:O-antigen ligase